MTGRLERNERGQRSAKYNDARVRMVEARAEGTLEEWLRNVDREKEIMLVYWEEMDHHPLFWSTFYVQLTEFEDGGLAIGLSCTHLLADLTSATVFLKAWADTSFPGQMLQPPLFHPLPPHRPGNRTPGHRPYTSLINHYKYSIKNQTESTQPLPLPSRNPWFGPALPWPSPLVQPTDPTRHPSRP